MTDTGERRYQGPTCGKCGKNEATCARLAGCCRHCEHGFSSRKREALAQRTPAPAEAPAPAVVVVPVHVGVRPHALDLTDPLDRMYLELLPTPLPPPGERASEADLAELVDAVCPLSGCVAGAA
jgi:hypothetical protein